MKIFKGIIASFTILSMIAVTGCVKVELNESPQAVIIKMQEAMQNKKDKNVKGKSEGMISIDVKSDKMDGNISGELQTEYNAENINDPQFNLNVKLKASGTAEGEISGSISADINFRMLAKTAYVIINNLSVISDNNPEFTSKAEMLKTFIAGKWWKFPIPENAQKLSLNNPFSLSKKEITEKQANRIKALFKEIPLLQVHADLGGKDNNYNYLVGLNNENIIEFIKRIAEIMEDEITLEQEQEIQMGLTEIANIQAEVTIDGRTFELKNISNGTLKIQDPESANEISVEFNGELSDKKTVVNATINATDNGENVILMLNADFNNRPNVNVNIQVPENAQELPFEGLGAPSMMNQEMMDESMMDESMIPENMMYQ